MNPIFQHPSYLLKRQAISLTGKFRFYDPLGNLVMFSEQKMFKLREDINVFADENQTQHLFNIKAEVTIPNNEEVDGVTAPENLLGILQIQLGF